MSPPLGWSPCPETRARISAGMKARWKTPGHREKVSAALKGHAVSDEARRRMGEAVRAAWQDPAYREERRAAGLAPPQTVEARERIRQSNRAAWRSSGSPHCWRAPCRAGGRCC
jgi:hypothetical protein